MDTNLYNKIRIALNWLSEGRGNYCGEPESSCRLELCGMKYSDNKLGKCSLKNQRKFLEEEVNKSTLAYATYIFLLAKEQYGKDCWITADNFNKIMKN